MCGITGFTHWDGKANTTALRKAVDEIRHRGPNQQDVFLAEKVSIGAVRLKIIDMHGGDQPLQSEDGSTVVAFNGEIFNHRALRSELEALGHRFRSHCDTEVVLEAFREWDVDCFSRLRGMFGVALWSERSGRLVLARDRMGIKPLYILHNRGNLHFGSEIKAILAHPAVSRNLDFSALSDFLSYNYIPGTRTLIRGISKLPPGTFLEHTRSNTRVASYWNPTPEPALTCSLPEACEQLDSLLQQAVSEQMVSDVPVGIWLSGGLDSSTVLHYASRAGFSNLRTFSVSFESKSCDERQYFRKVAEQYGTRHEEFEIHGRLDLADTAEAMSAYSDEPGADAGALPVWYLSKMTGRSATVALSGEGGDELFGGYQTYVADRFARYLNWLPRRSRRLALGLSQLLLPVSDQKISFEYKVKRLLEGSLLPPWQSHCFWNGSFSEQQQKDLLLLPPQGGRTVEDVYHRISNGAGLLDRFLLFDQATYLPDNILYKVDRMSMAHSIEIRPALLDHRIVEFARRVPENWKIKGGTTKFLLRHTMKGNLPECVLHRSKKGFDIPAHEWFRGPLKPLLLDTVSGDAVLKTGLFDPLAVRNLISAHMDRKMNLGYQLWGLMTLFLWLKRWNIETRETMEEVESLVPVAIARR